MVLFAGCETGKARLRDEVDETKEGGLRELGLACVGLGMKTKLVDVHVIV